MAHDIEAAKSGRSACATCGEKIAKGEVRVAELYQDATLGPVQYEERYRSGDYHRERSENRGAIQRFHHLACASAKHPALVNTALKRPHDPDLIPDRAALEAQLAAALDEERKQRIAAATERLGTPVETAAEDPNLDPLLAQLADTPDDPETVAIVGDLYQSRGDPRGELISIQLAMRTAKRERAPELSTGRIRERTRDVEDSTIKDFVVRRDELIAQISPRLDAGDRSHWGLGFIRRLELGPKSSGRLQELAGLWTHPSMRVLSELRIELPLAADDAPIIAQLAAVLPRSLRKLEIAGAPNGGASLQPILAALRRLDELVLLGRMPDATLAHPTLSKIGVHGITVGYSHIPPPYVAFALLSPALLPAVREISIRRWTYVGNPLGELARSRWLVILDRVQLDEPHLTTDTRDGQSPPLPIEGVEALRLGLAGRKLVRLEISGAPIPLPVRAALTPLCDELVCPTNAVVVGETTTHVEHANKPEWGRGKIMKRHDGKLEVKFKKDVGVKVFKADAPFLVPVVEDD